MMEAVSISEMSINFYQTALQNITQDSHLHTHHCENLKSHMIKLPCHVSDIVLLVTLSVRKQALFGSNALQFDDTSGCHFHMAFP
jgi:hypothetical protein